MATLLDVQSRTVQGKKVKQLRREGLIPAVIFGHGNASRAVSVPALEFERLQHRASANSLLNLRIDQGEPISVLLHAVQRDPRSARPVHLELLEVRPDEQVKVSVPIHLDGHAPASDEGGIVVAPHPTVEIRANADRLLTALHIDISGLQGLDSHIRADQVQLPEGVELLVPPDTILVTVSAPRGAGEEESAPGAEGEAPASGSASSEPAQE